MKVKKKKKERKKKKQELLLLFMHEMCVGGYWQVTSLSGKERQKLCYRNVSVPFSACSRAALPCGWG